MTTNGRPRLPYKLPDTYDPGRRLIGAVAVQATYDALYPAKKTSQRAQQSARQFLTSEDGQYIMQILGISREKIERRLKQIG